MEAMKERPKTKKKKTESKKNVNAESFSVKKLSQEEKVTDIGNKNNSEEIAVSNFSEILCEESEMKKECTTNEKFASNKVTDSSQILESIECVEKESFDKSNLQDIQVKNNDRKNMSLNDETELCKNDFILKIKESSSVFKENKILLDNIKTLSGFDEKTEVKNVYPNLKSIQHCEKIEDIESMRTIVQTYSEEYTSKTYNEAVKGCQKFQLEVAGIENHILFALVKDFQLSRKTYNEAYTKMKYLKSKLNIEKNNVWKIFKNEIFAKGLCEDGSTVSVSKKYCVKELDKTNFCEVIKLLGELDEIVLSNNFRSYSVGLSKMKIEQYIYNMISSIKSTDNPNFENFSEFRSNEYIKKCISILFHYQRQSTKDKDFLEICRKWLKMLVFILLQNGKRSDYLFIVNHIIRSPSGIEVWASQLLQFPGSALCIEETKDILSCPCLYYVLLVLYLILNPAPDRNIFLSNVKTDASDSTCGKFALLDSDGEEEELFEVVRDWTSDDIISLLNQMSVANLYEHILFEKKGQEEIIKYPSKERIIKIFAFSTALIDIFFSGLRNCCNEEFCASVECICNMIGQAVCYVSDHWEYCEKFTIQSKSALQAEYDRFIFHVIYVIFNFEKLKVWKFLATLPYKCISKKMLWNILWIFHSSHIFEEDIYLEKDIDLKLNDDKMVSAFIEKLSTFEQSNQLYLLNAYKSIAFCGNIEKELLFFLVHEIFQVAFGKSALLHLSKEGTVVLKEIIKKYPDLLTVLLKEIQTSEDDSVNLSLYMFQEMDLREWIPKCEDVQSIKDWLLEMPLSSPKNFLARILLSEMNWDFSLNGKLVLPKQLHVEVAVLVLQAYMKYDRKGNEWTVSSGLTQMVQFATMGRFLREEERFVPWAWDLLFTLKLHALDQKFPLWVQIYDGFSDVDFLPDPFEEVWLQPLLRGYEEKHPVAMYLFLVMTNIGHNVRRLMVEGLQCLTALVESRQYLAAIQSLYYMLPFYVKNSDELLSKSEFIIAMNNLIVADMTVLSNISGPVVGAVLHKIAAMIKHQISQACSVTVECATPLLKLWISILLKVLSLQEGKKYNLKKSAKQIYFLLDVIVKISFIDCYTRSDIIDIFYAFGNPLLSSSNVQPTIWTKIFGSNTETFTILKKHIFPEYPCLAWIIIRSETKQKQVQDLWYYVQKEIAEDCDISPLGALKKACNFLKIKQPSLESLPIYRWAEQILDTSISHPILPLLWQNFFYCFFERISILNPEAQKSNGLNYFEADYLKKLKSRAQETAEYYKNCLPSSQASDVGESENRVMIKKCIHNAEMCKIFHAFSFWIEDANLHLPSLCFSAYGPKYCCERLKLIYNNDQKDWIDLVSIAQLKDELEQKVHSWVHKKYSFCNVHSIELNEESVKEPISRHFNSNKDIKPLSCIIDIDPPMREIEDIALSSWNVLVDLIESKQSVIFDKARCFTDLSSTLKQLNSNYKKLVPEEFVNENYEEINEKACHRGFKCAGPAKFKLQLERYISNQRICQKIESNRIEYSMIQDQLLNLPNIELCIASIHIENYINALSNKTAQAKGEEALQLKKLGVSLFYHQIEAVNKVITSVKNYNPSRYFFSSSIESLGNVFILNQEDQLCSVTEAILKYPEAGELAFGVFNPNVASISVFLNMYEIITTAAKSNSPSTVFVLLNKIDLKYILKGANFGDRRKLFKFVTETLLKYGSNPSEEQQIVHGVLRDHFRIILLWEFPEFYDDCISFILEGMTTDRLSTNIWYVILHCFGCSTLNENSPMPAIESALKKYAENVLLPPDQQIYVSSQPIHTQEVVGTLHMFHRKFMDERKTCNIYKTYGKHVKPFSTFLAVLAHSLLSVLNENINQKQVINISQLWESLHLSFYPWLHPERNETCFLFPWCDEQMVTAKFMFQIFTISLKNFHDNLMGYNCEKCILSYFWNSYVEIYVISGFRHYSVSLYHTESLNLPWNQFHPNSEDLEGMCLVLQSDLLESRDFLAKISLKIPWIEIMKIISETMSPDYVRKTLVTLGRLLIISGLDMPLTRSNLHQNNLKALEELSWHLISLEDVEALLKLYYSTSDPTNLLNEELQTNSDVYVLQFLKIVCCMVVATNSVDYPHSNAKRLLYLHQCISALTLCTSEKKELILKNPEKYQKILPSLFTDIEKIIGAVVKPDQQISHALPLVNEAIGLLNKITNPKLEGIFIESILFWLKANPRSPLLLPCLQTACRCLNEMKNAVMIVECCVATRFNTDFYNPSDVHSIWKLILSSFQVRSSMVDEFIHACINKNAFLSLYCYLLDKIPKATSSESKRLLLFNVIDWINRCEIKESDEAKCLLLWDKVLELSTMLANENDLQVVKKVLSIFCQKISIFGEDKSSGGFLNIGRSSVLSVNFRFLCRILVAFLLLQMPLNASIRLQPMDPGFLPLTDVKSAMSSKIIEPLPSQAAKKAVDNVKILLKNKSYSALREFVNSAIEFLVDPRHSLNESRVFLKEYALVVFPKQYYLHALG